MQITVFGASGKVGRGVVALLAEEGHQVVAFVHRSNPFEGQATVRTVRGSISEPQAVAAALEGSQAVIVTLGSWGTKEKNIVSTGTKHILSGLPATRVERIITLTGASAWCRADQPNMVDRLTHRFLTLVAPKILADGEAHLRLLEASNQRWTCVRAPAMTSAERSSYRLSDRLPSLFKLIPRRAVVQALVDQLSDDSQIGKAPVIYSR